jgi:hypothetical protein
MSSLGLPKAFGRRPLLSRLSDEAGSTSRVIAKLIKRTFKYLPSVSTVKSTLISELDLVLFLAALGINGLLAGTSITKSVVELPAGKRIGSLAFVAYSRAADLKNGLPWYSFMGTVGPVLTILVAIVTNIGYDPSGDFSIALDIAALLSVAHMGSTALAAPNMMKISEAGDNIAQLDVLYVRFRRWNGLRAILQGLTFLTCLVAVYELLFQ